MSRVGNKPVAIPEGVEIQVQESVVSVKGPKGALVVEFEPEFVTIKVDEGQLLIERKNETKTARSRHGLYRSLCQNAIDGVSTLFSKTLEIRGVGFRVAQKGKALEMQLGFSHPVVFDLPEGLEVKFDEKNGNMFTISGIDKQLVGQVCANIRALKKPEPYKGKGIRYVDEHISLKAGKSAKK